MDDHILQSVLTLFSAGEISSGILIGNIVVFPRFFSTCSDKVAKILSIYHPSQATGAARNRLPSTVSETRPRSHTTGGGYDSSVHQDSNEFARGEFTELKDVTVDFTALPPYV